MFRRKGFVQVLVLTLIGAATVCGFAPSTTRTMDKTIHMPSASSQYGEGHVGSTFTRSVSSRILMDSTMKTKTTRTRLQATNGDVDYSKIEPKVYKQRWIQLGYLSMLALLSDWICFSVAAAPATFESAYAGHSAASLIDIFLFTNVASCFLITDIVSKFGLEKSIKFASALMAVGCFFRSGFSCFGPLLAMVGIGAAASSDPAAAASAGADLVPYWSLLTGTILVGAAQPFFQCTPPLLSATWFGSDERATSTAIALNFNQIGIATAFLVGGEMATSADGLSNYFGIISATCAVVTIGTLLQFQNKPPIPPSS